MENIKFNSTKNDVGFLAMLVDTVCESKIDIDLSLLLDAEKAEYVKELFEYSKTIEMIPNDFEDDFGTLTGMCLVTIFKTNDTVQVIVEDYAYAKQGEVTVKQHEADQLMLLEGQVFGRLDELIELYEPRKTIFVSFVKESDELETLVFT